MRVLNVNHSVNSRGGAGMAVRTVQMSQFLTNAKIDCTILAIEDGDKGVEESLNQLGVKVKYCTIFNRRFNLPYLSWKRISALVKGVDIIHLMGHWSILNAFVYFIARRNGVPYVVCPAGSLAKFGRSRLIKTMYDFLVGNAIIRNAAGWIAVTKGEFTHFEQYGVTPDKITVIPNGVFEESFGEVDLDQFRVKFKLPSTEFILFMGRVNPIKGPDILLEAFIAIAETFPSLHLVFAGVDEGMGRELQSIIRAKKMSSRIHFLGHILGIDKYMAFRAAKFLVVPSRSEAMSLVALEAGISGTLALVTDQCGFSEIKQVAPELEVGANIDSMKWALLNLLQNSDLSALSISYKNFIVREYSWNNLVPRYCNLYESILTFRQNESIDSGR